MTLANTGVAQAVVLADAMANQLDINASKQLRVEVAALAPVQVSGSVPGTIVLHSGVDTGPATGSDNDVSLYHQGMLVIDVTAFTGTSVTFTIQAKDPLSGKYFTVAVTAAITAAGTVVVFMDEQSAALPTAPGGFTYIQAHPITYTTLRYITTGTFTSVTYTIYAMLKPQ